MITIAWSTVQCNCILLIKNDYRRGQLNHMKQIITLNCKRAIIKLLVAFTFLSFFESSCIHEVSA